MAHWTTSEAITTQSRIVVADSEGREGYADVIQKSPGKIKLIPCVYSVSQKYDNEGFAISEKITVIDENPTFN